MTPDDIAKLIPENYDDLPDEDEFEKEYQQISQLRIGVNILELKNIIEALEESLGECESEDVFDNNWISYCWKDVQESQQLIDRIHSLIAKSGPIGKLIQFEFNADTE